MNHSTIESMGAKVFTYLGEVEVIKFCKNSEMYFESEHLGVTPVSEKITKMKLHK